MGGTGILTGLTSQTIFNAFVTGEFDFTLPSASMPLAGVFGVENREVDFERLADEVFALGDLAGQGGPTPNPVPPHTTVAGVPAKIVGRPECDKPSLDMDQCL